MKTTYVSVFVALFLMTLGVMPGRAQLQINELMQSNVDCLVDNLKECPDSWVEFYNTSDQSITLAGYQIGITDNVAEAWTMPSVTIPALRHFVIYCDKEEGNTHAPFRLESVNNGSVYLFKNG